MSEPKKIDISEFEQIVSESEKDYSNVLLKKLIKILIIIVIFAVYMFIPKTIFLIPTSFADNEIDPYKDPIMNKNRENIDASIKVMAPYKDKLIKIKSYKSKKIYYILPLADYSISARLKEKNKFFFLQNDFDNVAYVDYGLIWGDLAKKENFDKLYSHSNQTFQGDRRLVYNFKDKYYDSMIKKYDFNYLISHVSHTHIIPANKKVKKALGTIQAGQTVKLDGYLVDVFDDKYNRFAMSSLSLGDRNESSRGYGQGGGACEVMYVTKVQVGRKVFE